MNTMKRCEGSDEPITTDTAIIFGVGRCTTCKALVNVDDETGRAEEHRITVIDHDDASA